MTRRLSGLSRFALGVLDNRVVYEQRNADGTTAYLTHEEYMSADNDDQALLAISVRPLRIERERTMRKCKTAS